jgi:hypothetical protein
MGASQAKGCLGMNAEELRGLDGCQERFPGTFYLNVV